MSGEGNLCPCHSEGPYFLLPGLERSARAPLCSREREWAQPVGTLGTVLPPGEKRRLLLNGRFPRLSVGPTRRVGATRRTDTASAGVPVLLAAS